MDPEAVVRARHGAARLLRILLVEDERELAEMLARLLQTEGFTVDLAEDGQSALHLGVTRQYHLLLIDRGLPAIEGLDLLGRLRSRGVTARALVLTARGSVGDRVAGLDAISRHLHRPVADHSAGATGTPPASRTHGRAS
jgi:DNA-binding response OmpR family regulator